MGNLLAALLEKTGIKWFFGGVPVEMPAYFLPHFRVVEIQNLKRMPQGRSRNAAN